MATKSTEPKSTSTTTATTKKRSRRSAKTTTSAPPSSTPPPSPAQTELLAPLDVNGAGLIAIDAGAGSGMASLPDKAHAGLSTAQTGLMSGLLSFDTGGVETWSVNDLSEVSSTIPEMDTALADQRIKSIKRQQAHVSVVKENIKLKSQVYSVAGEAAKMISSGIKAATSVEQMGEAWNQLETAQESTRMSQVKLQNKRIERQGLENEQTLLQRKLVAQENNYRSKIAELEQRTSSLRESQYYPAIGSSSSIDV